MTTFQTVDDDKPIDRAEIADQAIYAKLLEIEHEPNRTRAKRLATILHYALQRRHDDELRELVRQSTIDETTIDGLDINGRHYQF